MKPRSEVPTVIERHPQAETARSRGTLRALSMTMGVMILAGGVLDWSWGVQMHGPLPDPSESHAERHNEGARHGLEPLRDGSQSEMRERSYDHERNQEPATAAERARDQQYGDAWDGRPWFGPPNVEEGKTHERPAEQDDSRHDPGPFMKEVR